MKELVSIFETAPGIPRAMLLTSCIHTDRSLTKSGIFGWPTLPCFGIQYCITMLSISRSFTRIVV